MITRIDRLQVELPPPSEPDPAGAAAVQELLGGKFGELSTLGNSAVHVSGAGAIRFGMSMPTGWQPGGTRA